MTNMKEPTKADLLSELARLKAQNERLDRLVLTKRPELKRLRRVEVSIRNLAQALEWKAQEVGELHSELRELLGTDNDDLPSLMEMRGIFSGGCARVQAALASAPAVDAVDPSVPPRESGPRATEDSSSSSPASAPAAKEPE